MRCVDIPSVGGTETSLTPMNSDAEYIINHAEVPIIFATQQHVSTLLGLAKRTPTVKTIVSIDKLDYKTKKVLVAWGKEYGIEIMDFPECVWIRSHNRLTPDVERPSSTQSRRWVRRT